MGSRSLRKYQKNAVDFSIISHNAVLWHHESIFNLSVFHNTLEETIEVPGLKEKLAIRPSAAHRMFTKI